MKLILIMVANKRNCRILPTVWMVKYNELDEMQELKQNEEKNNIYNYSDVLVC